jgi:flagellar hook-associated protein 3 FlgL
MRVTSSMMVQSAIQGMRARLADLNKAQNSATTLRRINLMSDDPLAAGELSQLVSSQADVTQYRRNITLARTKLDVEDSVLTSMRAVIDQAKSVAQKVSTLSPVDPERQRAVTQLADLQMQLVSLGNTKVGDQYIFGGTSTGAPPFQADGTYVGDSAEQQVQLDEGAYASTVHTGDHSIGGALVSFGSLQSSVATESASEIELSVTNLQAFSNQLLSDQADVGARKQVINDADTRLAARSNLNQQRRDAIDAIDPAEALVTVQTAQASLERAYAVVSRVIQTNIIDYLK